MVIIIIINPEVCEERALALVAPLDHLLISLFSLLLLHFPLLSLYYAVVVVCSPSHRIVAVAVSLGYSFVDVDRLEGPVHRLCPRLLPATHGRFTPTLASASPTNRGNLL